MVGGFSGSQGNNSGGNLFKFQPLCFHRTLVEVSRFVHSMLIASHIGLVGPIGGDKSGKYLKTL